MIIIIIIIMIIKLRYYKKIIKIKIKRIKIIMIIKIKIIIKTPRYKAILGGCPAGHRLISWEKGSPLALVGNPSRDGVSTNILVLRHLKANPQLL